MWGVVRKRERVKEWGQKAQRESRRGFTLFFPNFVRYLDHGFSDELFSSKHSFSRFSQGLKLLHFYYDFFFFLWAI